MNEEDCLYLLHWLKCVFFCFLFIFRSRLWLLAVQAVGTAAVLSLVTFVTSLCLVSFHFCCIGCVQTLYSFSMLCSTCVVLLSCFLSNWILLFTVSVTGSVPFSCDCKCMFFFLFIWRLYRAGGVFSVFLRAFSWADVHLVLLNSGSFDLRTF